jgi:hypothetical protein
VLLVLALLAEVGSVSRFQLSDPVEAVFVIPAHSAISVRALRDLDVVRAGGFSAGADYVGFRWEVPEVRFEGCLGDAERGGVVNGRVALAVDGCVWCRCFPSRL